MILPRQIYFESEPLLDIDLLSEKLKKEIESAGAIRVAVTNKVDQGWSTVFQFEGKELRLNISFRDQEKSTDYVGWLEEKIRKFHILSGHEVIDPTPHQERFITESLERIEGVKNHNWFDPEED